MNPITAQDWLERAKKPEIHRAIETDGYAHAYSILLSHFHSQKPMTWERAIVSLHLVYGWMPRIPNIHRPMIKWSEEKSGKLVEALNQTRTEEDLHDAALNCVKGFATTRSSAAPNCSISPPGALRDLGFECGAGVCGAKAHAGQHVEALEDLPKHSSRMG